MTDFLTVLTHSHSRLAKRWLADGTISGYDETKNYTVSELPVADIAALSAALSGLERKSSSAVIRGKFKGDAAAAVIDSAEHKPGLARKIMGLYDDVPHHWVLIEVDKFTPVADPVLDPVIAITEYVTSVLPSAFQDISYHWQLSSSAGHPDNAGRLKVHLWFWLSTPTTSIDLKAWAKSAPSVVLDTSVFNPVQFHYTSTPLFAEGVSDPVPRRSGLVDGLFGDAVDLDLAVSPASPGTALAVWDDDLLGLSPTLGWTLGFAREVLMDLNADCDRATWVNDLAALHHEMGGREDALDLAVEWSETASKFSSRKDVEDRWASFGKYRGGTPMTGRWLLKRRTECNTQLKYTARVEWAKLITEATEEFIVREKVCPQIVKDTRLDDMGREALAQLLVDAFKRLGTKYPIAECRKLVAEKRQQKDRGADVPTWAEPWVYVTDDDKFFRPDSEEWLTTQGFNAKFSRELPTDEDGNITTSAAFVALNVFGIKTVTRALYLPWATTATFIHSGVECVNTYRPSSPPTPVVHLSAADHEVVRLIIRHIELLGGGRHEIVTTMLNWMAHNVQHPGVKVRWSPLWKGIEGDGKTVIGSLMSAVMGRPNVKNVTPKVLGTDFTGWAQGSAVVVLEEIRLTGHSRHDILNALKPFITNDSIEVHPKGKDTIEVINTTNYLAFTNFVDALPLSDTDRRWWIVFTPFASSDEMEAAVRKWAPDLGTYFTLLHDAIQKHPAVLRRWLLDYKISATFRPNGRAPMTDEKAVMIGLGVSEEEDAVREILDTCEASAVPGDERSAIRGVTPDLFSSRCLGDALLISDSDISINTSARNRLFSKMGFTRMAKKVKWDGEAHAIWVRGMRRLEPDDVRQILMKTIVKNCNEDIFDENTANSVQKGSDLDDLF